MKGTEIIVKALIEEGVDTLFGYPGGQAIDILMPYMIRIRLK